MIIDSGMVINNGINGRRNNMNAKRIIVRMYNTREPKKIFPPGRLPNGKRLKRISQVRMVMPLSIDDNLNIINKISEAIKPENEIMASSKLVTFLQRWPNLDVEESNV